MTVVKADGYGHGLAESARAAREGGRRLARRRHHRRGPRPPRGRRHRTRALLAHRPRRRLGARPSTQDVDVTAYSVDELDAIAATGDAGRASSSRSTPACTAVAPRSTTGPRSSPGPGRARTTAAGRSRASGRTSPPATSRTTRPTTRRSGCSSRRSRRREQPGWTRRCAHLANSAAAILRPSSRLDLVRVGIASYGLDPAPGRHRRDRAAAGDDGPRQPGDGQARRGGRRGLLRPHVDRRPPDHARPGPGRVRRRRSRGSAATAPRSRSPGRDGAIRGRICMDQLVVDLDGDDPGAGRRGRPSSAPATTASRPRRTGPRPAGRSATRS